MRGSTTQRGFTILELVIVIILLGMLAVLGSNMVGDTMQTSLTHTQNHSSGSQARWAMERLAREIREVNYGVTDGYVISPGKTATGMAFTKVDGTVVTIANSGALLTLAYGGVAPSTLTDQVSSFKLAYYDQFGGCPDSPTCVTTSNADIRFVEITMTVANAKTGKTDSLRTRVFLRNAQNSA